MLPRHSGLRRLLSVLLLGVLSAAGCGEKKIAIVNFPSFYDEALKTVAIVPFRNATRTRDAGNIISDALAAQLAVNTTYKTYNRNDLSILQSERDLRTELGLDNATIAAKFRKVGNVQAVLAGTVITYAATERRERRQKPIKQWNKHTKQMQIVGYQPYVFTRNEANVAVTARLIRVSDGATIFATPSPVQGHSWAQGSPPQADKHACRTQATAIAVNRLVQTFAVTRRIIKVKESRDFRTATELYDNKWDWRNRFNASDEKAYIVVRLPKSCDRNRFRITFIRKGRRKDLMSQKILWETMPDVINTARGFKFDPARLAGLGGGSGEYEAKFYSGPEPVMRHTFRIE